MQYENNDLGITADLPGVDWFDTGASENGEIWKTTDERFIFSMAKHPRRVAITDSELTAAAMTYAHYMFEQRPYELTEAFFCGRKARKMVGQIYLADGGSYQLMLYVFVSNNRELYVGAGCRTEDVDKGGMVGVEALLKTVRLLPMGNK